MAVIELKNSPLTVLIDDDLFNEIMSISEKWYYLKGYAVPAGKTKGMHRFLLDAPPDIYVDHINGNKLDNRIENLRFCTRKQNFANQKKRKNNTTGFKGVYYKKRVKKFRAKICSIEIGLYNTAEEAHRAYIHTAKEMFGEFANAG